MEEKVTQQTNKEVVNNNETISQSEEKVVSSQQSTEEMTDEELLDNMAGLKIVTNDGQEKELSAAGFQKLVKASLMQIPAGIQARAAVAAATDSMEKGLPTTTNPQKVRTIDASGNSAITEMSTLASVVGGLQMNDNIITDDMNSYIQTGTYALNDNSIKNLPPDVSNYYGTLFVIGNWINARQMLMPNNDTFIYVRNYRVNDKLWSAWRKI